MVSNRPEFIEVMSATRHAPGCRVTPVNWHLTGEEAGYIVADCEAKAFVADARFAGSAASAASEAPDATVRLAVGGAIEGFEDYEAVLAPHADDDIDDPTLGVSMLYTSGTTGRPKGVYRSRRAAQSQTVLQLAATSGYDAERHRHLCTGPLYHAAPLAFSMTAPLSSGVGVVLMDGWDAEEALRLIDRHRITHTHMVPTMFHRLLSLPDEVRERYDVSSLRFVIHGAAPCPVPVKKAIIDWWGPIVHEYYAATEGTGALVSSKEWLERPGTVGKPATDDHVRIVRRDGEPCPAGVAGLVYLAAPAEARFEYFKDDEKTARVYEGDHYTLGDVGYLDEDGYLYLTDRSTNLIISGGVNVYPAEVEAVLLTHPAVGDVAVIGVPDDDMGESVLAVVEPHDGEESATDLPGELVAHCRDRLAHYKCPRHVELVDCLPRRDNGKLYKRELRDEYRTRYGADGDR
ncbi:MAG: AMP-binding protein [Acidimicrobiia bacterium]|nr:AMP-binding protein [Acidimicrobiia bacterium]